MRSRPLIQLAAVAGSMALVCLGLEHAQRVDGLRAWLDLHPTEALINVLLAATLGWALLAATGRAVLAVVLAAVPFALLTAGHVSKLAHTGKPLYPWDVLLFRQAFVLSDYAWRWAVVIALLAAAGLVGVVLERRWWASLGWRARLAALAPAVLLPVLLWPDPAKALRPLDVQHRLWVQAENYRDNGLLLAFTLNLPATRVQRPPNYSRAAVREAARAQHPIANTDEQPTVIVVMSESFFDVTTLPGLTFTPDPLPTVHRLQRESASGRLYAPSFGGGTANTEFEALTGHSMRFLPTGSVPYQQYLRRPHTSLASIYARQGYRTAAIHTFHRWFWERDTVYPKLGFHSFTGLEDMPEAPRAGAYTSDAELTRRIVDEVQRAPTPLFLFAVSMEAHGPYAPARYETSDIDVTGALDDAARAELGSYVEAIHHADRELQSLIDALSGLDRPVIVLFFGDHLPSLPLTYRQLGVINAQGLVDRADLPLRTRLHQVPLVAWSNRPGLPRELGDLSASFFPPLVLELTGTPGTRYTDFLRAVRQAAPVVLPGIVAEADGAPTEEPSERFQGLEAAWWTLEYDALFGDDWLSQDATEG